MSPLIEVAVESLREATAAREAGADRVELCACLADGGTTPSAGTIAQVVGRAGLPVVVMVRARPGDFVYSSDEIEAMLHDAAAARRAGAHGVASGALRSDGTIDRLATAALVAASRPLPFTFHRAFDEAPDAGAALEDLVGMGVTRVLTSGGVPGAAQGAAAIARLVAAAGGRISVMAGGGIRAHNVVEVLAATGVRELHLGPRHVHATRRMAPSPRLGLAKPRPADDGDWTTLDAAEVASVTHALASRHAIRVVYPSQL